VNAPWFRRVAAVAAVAIGAATGVILFLAADYIGSSSVLPDPTADVEWVPTAERPYLQRDAGWYELKRGFRGRDYWGARIYPVRTDADGFRADDERPDKAGAAAVIFLGDSFTYGLNGPWAETFAGMYDRSVASRVANAGVPSYSPTPYLYRYQQALADKALAPRHTVVVGLDISDVHDEAGVWTDGEQHPANRRAAASDAVAVSAQRAAAAATPGGRVRNRLRFTHAVYQYLRYSLLAIPNPVVFDQMKSRFTWDRWDELDRTPAALTGFQPIGVRGGLNRISAKLSAIVTLAHANDATVVVLIYPWPAQLQHADTFSWSAFVTESCRLAGCDGVIDTIPAFRDYARGQTSWYRDLFVKGDVHFNTEGNRLVFSALRQQLPPLATAQR